MQQIKNILLFQIVDCFDFNIYNLFSRKRSRVFVYMTPNGNFSMTDRDGSHATHSEINDVDFTLPYLII